MSRPRLGAIVLLASGLLASGTLSGCSGRNDARTVITLWHAYSGDERAALDELAASWNAANPDVACLVGLYSSL